MRQTAENVEVRNVLVSAHPDAETFTGLLKGKTISVRIASQICAGIDSMPKLHYNVLHEEDDNMTISLRLSNEDTILIKKYAGLHNMSVSDLFRQSVMEKIEDEYDLKCYEKAMENYRSDPAVFSLDEVECELGLK